MKKRILISACMVISAVALNAQGIYIRGGAGYGMPAATNDIGENYIHSVVYDNNGTSENNSTEVVTASYGAGVNFNAGFGFKFNENFIFDVGLQFIDGKKFETSYIYKVTDIGYSSRDENIQTTQSSGLFINPTFIFSAGFGKRAPYGKFGVILASPKVKSDEYYYSDADGVMETQTTWEYSGGLSVGYQTAIGINWKITDKLDVYTEAGFVSMTYYAKEGNMTSYIYNGEDQLGQLNIIDKKVLFEKEYDPSTVYSNVDEPYVTTREATPFSHVSVQVGIRFAIWNAGE